MNRHELKSKNTQKIFNKNTIEKNLGKIILQVFVNDIVNESISRIVNNLHFSHFQHIFFTREV